MLNFLYLLSIITNRWINLIENNKKDKTIAKIFSNKKIWIKNLNKYDTRLNTKNKIT